MAVYINEGLELISHWKERKRPHLIPVQRQTSMLDREIGEWQLSRVQIFVFRGACPQPTHSRDMGSRWNKERRECQSVPTILIA